MNSINLVVKWGTSRGRNTYGHTTCTLYADNTKVASCNGGGYDMRGTVIGDFITQRFNDELHALRIPMSRRNGENIRELYGLTFHNPNFDPSKAIVKHVAAFGGKDDIGKTVEQLEKEGKSLGLERYQAFYSASSRVPTKKHTVARIDGGCGLSSVEAIIKALGYQLHSVYSTSKIEVYNLMEAQK